MVDFNTKTLSKDEYKKIREILTGKGTSSEYFRLITGLSKEQDKTLANGKYRIKLSLIRLLERHINCKCDCFFKNQKDYSVDIPNKILYKWTQQMHKDFEYTSLQLAELFGVHPNTWGVWITTNVPDFTISDLQNIQITIKCGEDVLDDSQTLCIPGPLGKCPTPIGLDFKVPRNAIKADEVKIILTPIVRAVKDRSVKQMSKTSKLFRLYVDHCSCNDFRDKVDNRKLVVIRNRYINKSNDDKQIEDPKSDINIESKSIDCDNTGQLFLPFD